MHLVLHDGSGLRLGKVLNISCLYVYTEVIPFHCHPRPPPLLPSPQQSKEYNQLIAMEQRNLLGSFLDHNWILQSI